MSLFMGEKPRNILRGVLFGVFFASGAGALTLAILTGELRQYYNTKAALRAEKQYSDKLKSLNIDYEALELQLDQDPNLIGRIASATLGAKRSDANTIYPKARSESLAAAAEALTGKTGERADGQAIPSWLERSGHPRRRTVLFAAGCFLVLISFGCFAPVTSAGDA